MNKELIGVGIGVTSVLVGVGAGYFIGKKHAEIKFDKIMEAEIEEAKKFYARLYKAEEYSTPEGAADILLEEAVEAFNRYNGKEPDQPSENDTPKKGVSRIEDITEVSEVDGIIEENVFENSSIDQLAIDDRRPDVPYVISVEEFMENEPEHDQMTVTYYEGDKILADERDQVIEDQNGTVGRTNLTQFGLASGDPNTVHVRHEMKHLDFEVIRSSGKYAHEVAGFTEDLKHADGRMRRGRNRWDDE